MAEKEKTTNNWSLICKRPLMDEQTKLMSLIDIVEKISIKKSPGAQEKEIEIPSEMAVVSHWTISEKDQSKDITLETSIKDQDSEIRQKNEMDLKVTEGKSRQRTIIKFPSLRITGSGTYIITSTLKDENNKALAKKELPFVVEVK